MVWPSMPPLDAPLIVSKAGVAAASVGMHVARMSASGWPVPWMALPACRRQDAKQTRFHLGKQGVASVCDAQCDAFSPDRIDVLTRAVILVAGMNLAEAERAAVLARVIADLTSTTTRIPQ